MSFTVLLLAYNENKLLKACLKQFPPWISEMLVLISEKPWNGKRSDTEGLTSQVVFEAVRRDPRVQFLKLPWPTEHDQRNYGLGRLGIHDWVFIVDADEFYTKEDWEKLRQTLENAPEDCRQVRCRMKTYWKTPEWSWSPPDSHTALIAVKPTYTVFLDKREVQNSLGMVVAPVTMHHMSWVRSDAEIRAKIDNWSHADDFSRDNWYFEKWLGWKPGMRGLHPYGNPDIEAVHDPAPDGIM